MLPDLPNVLGIYSRDNLGNLKPVFTPIDLHREPMITIIPKQQGVYLLLGMLEENDEPMFSQLSPDQLQPEDYTTENITGIEALPDRIS